MKLIRNNWFPVPAYAILLSTLIIAAAFAGSDDPPAGWEGFGEGVTISERTPIADILSKTDDFVGRTVTVEGEVTGVCRMMGCWIELRNAANQRLRVKVDDGVIVFPETAMGRLAIAQGMVERLEFTREEAVERARHEAEETGREFDPESVTPPFQEVRLRGTGAWIKADTTP